jgi:hypothetical protein
VLAVGVVLVVLGLLLMFGGRFFSWMGNLPGDIRWEGQNFSCFFPLATSIVLSIILTIVLNVIVRFLNR